MKKLLFLAATLLFVACGDEEIDLRSYEESLSNSSSSSVTGIKITEIKKLGTRVVVIYTENATDLCYSATNALPTISDYKENISSFSNTTRLTSLQEGITYYIRPYNSSKGIYGEVVTVTTNSSTDEYATPVELGISIKWADRGLLAMEQGKIGDSRSYYYGDPATREWGSKWRSPTQAEWNELFSLPNILTKQDGVEGYLISGKEGTPYADNSIFIPLPFSKYYWTSTWQSSSSGYVCMYMTEYSRSFYYETSYTSKYYNVYAVYKNE